MKPEDRLAIWERDQRICGICGEAVAMEHLEIDHILPVCAGGRSSTENLRASHRRCNRRKAAQDRGLVRQQRGLSGIGDSLQVRLKPISTRRLDALAKKLGLTRTGVIDLALARLAELEKIEAEHDADR